MLGLRFREQIRKHFVFVINRVVRCKHFKRYIRIRVCGFLTRVNIVYF